MRSVTASCVSVRWIACLSLHFSPASSSHHQQPRGKGIAAQQNVRSCTSAALPATEPRFSAAPASRTPSPLCFATRFQDLLFLATTI